MAGTVVEDHFRWSNLSRVDRFDKAPGKRLKN